MDSLLRNFPPWAYLVGIASATVLFLGLLSRFKRIYAVRALLRIFSVASLLAGCFYAYSFLEAPKGLAGAYLIYALFWFIMAGLAWAELSKEEFPY